MKDEKHRTRKAEGGGQKAESRMQRAEGRRLHKDIINSQAV
jgi:hypothetical protein